MSEEHGGHGLDITVSKGTAMSATELSARRRLELNELNNKRIADPFGIKDSINENNRRLDEQKTEEKEKTTIFKETDKKGTVTNECPRTSPTQKFCP